MAQSQQPPQAPPPGPGLARGLPADLELYSPFPFKGMDVKGSPIAIDDATFAWLENVFWIGTGQLGLLPSNNPVPLYIAPSNATIVSYSFYFINSLQCLAVFLSDGRGIQVPLNGSAITQFGPVGTFTSTTPPVTASYGAKYLLIGTSSGYFAWDGTILYAPGTLAPQIIVTSGGLNYSSAPTVTISGGSGTGATAVASIDNGQVTKVTLTNPGTGYLATDNPSLQIFFTGGGQTNAIAKGTATIGGGGVLSVQVIDGGTGYTNQPAVTFSGGGASTQATGVAAGIANSITQVIVVTPGVGYTGTPAVAFAAPAGGGDTATAIATIGYNGVTAITVTSGGSGYSEAPSVVITDPFGFGLGATGFAVMTANAVSSVTITNPGANYQGAVVNFVGGNPPVATAIIELMPQGGAQPISGTAIQVFKNRVWMVNNNVRYTSAAGDLANFSAAAGGIIVQNNDNYLIFKLYGLAQSSGFLYEFGDSSTNSISNPVTTVANNVASTNYTVTNVDPQVGCIWPQTIQPFGSAIVFANPTGVYGLYGSSVRKISGDLDDLFNALPPQTTTPSACIVTLFGIKCYALALKVLDPFLNTIRQLIFIWDGTRWFAATQDAPITSLTTVGTGGQFTAYGSDGQNIYQVLSFPSATLLKRVLSKYYGANAAAKFKRVMRFYLAAERPFNYDIVVHTELGDVDLGSISYPQAGNGGTTLGGYGTNLTVQGAEVRGAVGRFVGWTMTTTAAANNIDFMALAWVPDGAYY